MSVYRNVLKDLEREAEQFGYRVLYKGTNRCTVYNATITVDPRQTQPNKVYALAHEVGHAKTLLSCHRQFGGLTKTGNDKSWSTLEAEFQAWEYADRLMKRFDMYDSHYLKFKHSSLAKYYTY